nr:MAG TPA_asm: hypothetical protein [Caudoviricetes sp.]
MLRSFAASPCDRSLCSSNIVFLKHMYSCKISLYNIFRVKK